MAHTVRVHGDVRGAHGSPHLRTVCGRGTMSLLEAGLGVVARAGTDGSYFVDGHRGAGISLTVSLSLSDARTTLSVCLFFDSTSLAVSTQGSSPPSSSVRSSSQPHNRRCVGWSAPS